ncbi:MAG: hypothetical protein GDA67_16025 [Nitrospira sp. CR1.3]|nr:hypothetical protein [Nitrospira sp. CR1.3]
MDAPILTPQSGDALRQGKTIDHRTSGHNGHVNFRKVRLTVNLPQDLVEQVRDAVYWTPGLTIAWLIARAMRTSLADLHSTNHGPFPRRSKPLRAGRPRLIGQTMNLQMRSPNTTVYRDVEQVIQRSSASPAPPADSFAKPSHRVLRKIQSSADETGVR